jgi:hypothetical protein
VCCPVLGDDRGNDCHGGLSLGEFLGQYTLGHLSGKVALHKMPLAQGRGRLSLAGGAVDKRTLAPDNERQEDSP